MPLSARAGWLGAALALWAHGGPVQAVEDAYPKAATAYVLAVDDQVLWARAADTPRPPASLAKLLSALVLLRGDWDGQAAVPVSKAAAGIDGTRIGLRAGEKLKADDALTAMLVHSANDACMALAEHAAGSATAFVANMNALAQELGMGSSRFGTPCGLDAAGQQATASDLLRLARVAMDEKPIATRVGRQRAAITTLGGRRISFTNSNALVGRLRGTIGVKSGFTTRAGKCVIAAAERDGHRVWLVMLDAPDRWWVADGMIEAAFDRLERANP